MINPKNIDGKSTVEDYIFHDNLFDEENLNKKPPKKIKPKDVVKNNNLDIKDIYIQQQTQIKLEEDVMKKADEKAKAMLIRVQEEIVQMKVDAKKQLDKEKQKVLEQSHELGFRKGKEEGYEIALNQNINKMDEENKLFLEKLKSILQDIELQKEVILSANIQNMCDLAIDVAQKVIGVSISSSAKVIEKMILDATEKLKNKQWIRIHISATNLALITNSHIDIIDGLKRVSDNIKIIPIENEESGSCIIELPDQIIDITTSTQIENVKDILQNELH